jgi:tetratricopeptide (TPR) repeat protein
VPGNVPCPAARRPGRQDLEYPRKLAPLARALLPCWLRSRTDTYLRSQGQYAEALPLYQRELRIHEQAWGCDLPGAATSHNDAGQTLADLGQHAEALPVEQWALRIDEAALGADHPEVATDLNYIGRAFADLDRAAEALRLYQRALAIRETVLGPDHPSTRQSRNYVEEQ